MIKQVSVIFLLVAFLAADPALAQRGTPLEGIVAVVNEDVILRSELEHRSASIRDNIANSGNPMPPMNVLRRQVLERMIVERVQLQRAEMAGIVMSEDMLNQTMSNIAGNNGMTLEEFAAAAAQEGVNFARIREEVRNDMTMQQIRQREVLSRIEITQRDIDAFLASAEAQSLDSREFQVSHILLRLDTDASGQEIERVRALSEELLRRAREGEDFAQLAVSHSQGQQALEGGDLGWRRSTQLPSVFAERVVSMQTGQVADIIRTSGAVHIIKLNEVRGGQERVIRSQTRAAHIVVLPGPLMNEGRALSRLNEVHEQLQQGADFADMARQHSEDVGSAGSGGLLGWISPGELPGEFENTLAGLEPGQFSRPFATPFGWHIAKVLERRDHDSTEEIRMARAAQILRERRAEEATENWLRRLYDEAYIENRLDG